jgi:uncharacterized membrane protein YfcA
VSADILVVIVVLSAVQSIFGVGVLLFGTPALLILDYDFLDALAILLPVSLAINAIQVAKDWRWIDRGFYAKILLYTIPLVVACLFLVTRVKINMALLIGLFVIFVALKNVFAGVGRLVEGAIRYERTYFVSMGVVHGLTNLGGSLLTAAVHAKGYPKDAARATTAVSYGTFAVFQIVTLGFALDGLNRPVWAHLLFVVTGVTVFFLTETLVYSRIDQDRYVRLFAALLFVSGVVLVIKGIL